MKRRRSKTDSAGTLGLPVDYLRTTCGLPVDYMWTTCGLPVDSSKLDNEALSSINGGRFPDQLSNFQILKKNTAK